MQAARNAFEAGDWESVASRAYYAAYHRVAAVLEEKAGIRRDQWRAIVIVRDFRENFARRGYLFSIRDADAFDTLRSERYAADYSNERFNERRASRMLSTAEDLSGKLKEALDT